MHISLLPPFPSSSSILLAGVIYLFYRIYRKFQNKLVCFSSGQFQTVRSELLKDSFQRTAAVPVYMYSYIHISHLQEDKNVCFKIKYIFLNNTVISVGVSPEQESWLTHGLSVSRVRSSSTSCFADICQITPNHYVLPPWALGLQATWHVLLLIFFTNRRDRSPSVGGCITVGLSISVSSKLG